MSLLTLLTDFGTGDYYVGAVKGSVLSQAPQARIVDLTHDIAPGDIEGGAFILAAAAPSFPPKTLHLAVVDPGVGSDRKILVAESQGAYFLGPDNGLLSSVLTPTSTVIQVERKDLFLPCPGATFHGRDRFAPVAAFLLNGGKPADLGPQANSLHHLPQVSPRRESNRVEGRIAHIDRFGNLVTNIPARWVQSPDEQWIASPLVAVGNHRTVRWIQCYDELESGQPGALIGSLATVELSLKGASLAADWGAQRDDSVVIHLEEREDQLQ